MKKKTKKVNKSKATLRTSKAINANNCCLEKCECCNKNKDNLQNYNE